jgi:hypothetical protein
MDWNGEFRFGLDLPEWIGMENLDLDWTYWNGLEWEFRFGLDLQEWITSYINIFQNVKNPHYTEKIYIDVVNVLLDRSGHSTQHHKPCSASSAS